MKVKLGLRKPSLKRKIAARTSWKRYARHSLGLKMPKGMGILANPKKAIYNKVYRKTTFGIGDIFRLFSPARPKQRNGVQNSPSQTLARKNPVADKHFSLSESIPILYKQRDQMGMIEKTIAACMEQIELASDTAQALLNEYPEQPLPAHLGYKQLAIILAKQNKYHEAITLCEQAKKQGWAGDWDKRIENYRKELQ
jgi:hypothetical protein